jgi:NitT/TauT family transport system permease protein
MTGATAGLGWIVHNAGAGYQTDRIYGTGLCIVILGVLINRFLILIRRAFLPWSDNMAAPWLYNPKAIPKKINNYCLFLWCLGFVILAVLGLRQIFLGVNLIVTI